MTLQFHLSLQLLAIPTAVALTNVISKRLFADAEHESKTQLESVWLQKVALAPDNEATSCDEHTRWGCLGYLVGVYPVDLRSYLVLPTRTMAHFECGRLV